MILHNDKIDSTIIVIDLSITKKVVIAMPINKDKSKTCFVTMDLDKLAEIETLMQARGIKSFSRQAGYMLDQYMEVRRAIKAALGIEADSIADIVKMLLSNK